MSVLSSSRGSERSRTLSIRSPAIALVQGRPVLEPVRLSGREGLNGLFTYELLLKTPDAQNGVFSQAIDFDLDSFVGREIGCRIALDGAGRFVPGAVGRSAERIGAGVRPINALITEACLWGEEGRHVQYKLTLRPWLHLATLNSNCRIFQNQTVVEILDAVLGRYAFPVHKRLVERYPVRDYQTQFNETDFDFFSRLCQEWGISYHFEHEGPEADEADEDGGDRDDSDDDRQQAGAHRLVLTDAMGAYAAMPSAGYREVDYHAPGWKAEAEYLHSFAPRSRLASGRYATRDYDYMRPKADLSASRAEPRPTGQADGEVYRWHGGGGAVSSASASHFAQPNAGGTSEPNDPHDEGRQIALLRMQALRTGGQRARAGGNLRGMVPGCTFALAGHPRQDANVDYLVLDTDFLIEDVGADSQSRDAGPGRSQHWRVQVDLTLHPMTEPLRPACTLAQPRTHGPQTALVVGPDGQALWTDALGRIKVQFPWDRIGRKNQHSTCWIRVSSPWAGNQLGGVHLPRVGQEVIVDFIGGNPDLPICTGRVHNQLNQPPWQLPGQAALSGLRSRELTPDGGNSAAGRSNHLVLDDTARKIQVQLKSDHQSSSLSLGHIARIEDHAGRKDARGEGFELRSDGHGVVRAADGLLVTTESRANAAGHAKSLSETLARLATGQRQHESWSEAARQVRAQERGDQDEVARAIAAQNDEIKGSAGGATKTADGFPELARPHVVIGSAAGIGCTSTESTHIASAAHNAFTSGGHTSISAGRSLLVSVKDAIRLFAHKAGMRLIAASADIDISALQHSIRLLAKLEITQTADRITIQAKEEVLINGGGSFSRWNAEGVTHGTGGKWVEHAAGHVQVGPTSLPVLIPDIPRSAFNSIGDDPIYGFSPSV